MVTALSYKLLFFTIVLLAIAVSFASAEPSLVAGDENTKVNRPCEKHNYYIAGQPMGGQDDNCGPNYFCKTTQTSINPDRFDCDDIIKDSADENGNTVDLEICRGTCQKVSGNVPSSQSNGLSMPVLVGAGLIIALLLAGYSVMKGQTK